MIILRLSRYRKEDEKSLRNNLKRIRRRCKMPVYRFEVYHKYWTDKEKAKIVEAVESILTKLKLISILPSFSIYFSSKPMFKRALSGKIGMVISAPRSTYFSYFDSAIFSILLHYLMTGSTFTKIPLCRPFHVFFCHVNAAIDYRLINLSKVDRAVRHALGD